MIKIIEGTWQDIEHTAAVLTVMEDEKEPYIYTCTECSADDDEAPLNKQLWAMLQENNSMVQDSTLLKVLKGEIAVPEGYTLRNGQLLNDEEEKIKLKTLINTQLDSFYTGRSLAIAERDPVYAANRKNAIDRLLKIETLPGFPYDIDFSKLDDDDADEEGGEEESEIDAENNNNEE